MLTCEAWETGTVKTIHSVLAGGTVEAGGGGTLVHLLLTVLASPTLLTVAGVVTNLKGVKGGRGEAERRERERDIQTQAHPPHSDRF